MDNLLDNGAQLRKLKINDGLNILTASTGSSHIMASKIKRAIKGEINWQNYERIAQEVKTKHLHINEFLNRLFDRVERAQGTSLEVMFNTLNNDGAMELVKLILGPAAVFRAKREQLDAQKRKQLKEENSASIRMDELMEGLPDYGLDPY